MGTKNKPNEIYLTRVYDAPVKTVWAAFTESEQVAQWWGPRGFTITTHSKDLKTGGHWHYIMHGPDGTDYENTTKYLEVEKFSRLVYDHGGHADRKPLFRVTVEFHELKNNKTKMEMTMALDTEQAAIETRKFIKQAGGNSTWDRLAEYLEKQDNGKEVFVINRTFDTSLSTMFEMWTNPEHFKKWLGPTGMSMQFTKADIKAGATSSYSMTDGKDLTMYGQLHYLEIEKPHKIVYTQNFTDKNGNMARHPMAPTWPATMKTTVTFNEEGPNQTRVTVRWEVVGNATLEEMQTFIQGRAGMTQGWTGSFDKLEEYLAKH